MPLLKIERTAEKGYAPKVEVYLDEKQRRFGFELSRALTRTTGESGEGIFDKSTTVHFQRQNAEVTVEFDERWSTADKNTAEIMDTVITRVKTVNEAFEAQYDYVNETTTYEF